MIYQYEINDWKKLSRFAEKIQNEFSILDDEEPIVDSNFDNFDEREMLCLTRVNLQMN